MKTKKLTIYQKMILADTGAPVGDLAAIEEIIRSERPTLGSLSRATIRKLAKQAAEVLALMDKDDPDTAAWYRRTAR